MQGFVFTDDVRRVLATAREESRRLHHEYVGPEHILLAFTAPVNAVPARMIGRIGVQPADLRTTLEHTIRRGDPARQLPPDLPYTSRAKKSLELAMMEARDLRHDFVGTEHLLLGLLREETNIAAQVLSQHGVRAEAVRGELLQAHPPETDIADVEGQFTTPGRPTTFYHLRITHPRIILFTVLWTGLWVYLRPDILNWRLLVLLLVIVVPPMLLLRFTRRPPGREKD